MRFCIRSIGLGLSLACAGGCGGSDALVPQEPTYGDTDLYNPGMGGKGNFGPLDQFLPTDWSYLFFVETFGQIADCLATHLCGHGGAALSFGTMGNGKDSLVYSITSNYPSTDDFGDPVQVIVQASGVQHDAIDLPAAPANKALRLALDYAFLTSRNVPGDSAVIRLVVDGNTNSPVVLLRVRSSDLGPTIPLRSGGCGPVDIGTSTDYARCSDWREALLDITPYRGHSIATQFVVGEAGNDTNEGIALLLRRVRIQQEQ